MDGVKRAMAENTEQPSKTYPLDPCPLCGGGAAIEYVGTWCNAVCQKCGCSSGSYKSPFWAAKRWNSRVAPKIKEDDKPAAFAALFIQDGIVDEPGKPAEPKIFKPYTGKKKTIVDLPGQMLFDFAEGGNG